MDLEELAKQYGGVSTKVEPVNLEDLAKKLGGTSRPVKERTVTEAFTDPAAKFASGIGQLIQFPGQIYGLTTGAIKDKDFGTTGLQGLGQNLQDYAKKKLSEQYLAEEAETARKVEEAEKKGQLAAFGTQVGEVLKNPLTQGIGFAAEQIPQAIPSAIAALIPGAGPALAAELRAAQAAAKAAVGNVAKKEAADAALKLAQDAALKSQISRGTKAAIGTGAVQQGADIGSGSFEEIKQYLMAEKGLNEDQAAAQALNLARAAGVSGTAISLLAQKLPGAQALERALAGERLGTGRIKGAIAGAIKNIPEEMVEEGGGKFTQNLALRDVNPEQSLTAGLGQTLGQAALGAGLIGGGAGAISGGKPTINPEDVKNAEFEKRKAEDIQRATEKRAEIAAQMEVVKNPLGALTEADLGPELTSYVNQHRTDTGKPTLTTYSLDDVVDALPGKDKVKETTALNALVAQKTGYTTEIYTPDAVTALAEQKNVDVNAPGFGDFLSRTTGINDIAQMSQPQLHSAVMALQKLPTFETKQAIPEGTNATRYTPEQVTQAVDALNAKMDEVGKDELTFKETTTAIEKATGLKGSAVNALVNDARANGSIVTEDKKVSVPSRTTPTGYDIQEEIGVEEEQAESYDVMSGDQKVRSMDTQEKAEAHAEKLNSFAQAELKKTQEGLKAQEQKIAKSESELLKYELNGLVGTPAELAAQEAHQAVLDEAMPVIADLKNQEDIYSRPVTVVPVGIKKVQPKTYRVTKGDTVKGTKATREEAEQSIFEDLSDKEIQELAKTKSPKLQARVNAEIERRSTAPAPAPRTPEQQQKIQAAQATLQSMLGKFGLQDVALKIVNAIEQGAEGSYAAKVIQLAIDAQNPVRVLRHESLHALKELGFFTDSQWASLERQAKAEWVDKYLKNNQTKTSDGRVVSRYDAYVEMGLNEADILEEAIADAFGDFDANNAPPGMLNALLNKLRNFFSTLKSYLNGQGYESYKDIFGKIEKGELKPSKPAVANKEVKKSLIRPAVEGETEISTRNPQGVKRTNDPIAEMLSIDEAAVREAMKSNPDMYKRTIQAIQGYGFVPLNTPPKDVIDVFKRNIINNLMYLYNAVPEDIRERSKLWYDGANRIATDMSKNYKVSMEQVAGIMAAMSPQKDWFQNVSMAERALDILTEQGDKAWDENMLKYAESYVKEASNRKEREKRQLAFDRIKRVAAEGTTLNNMTEDNAAAFIRAYDEAYNSRQYRIVTPEGGFGDLVLNNDGKPATMMWSTYDPIKKTVSIFRDGNRKNISEQLGEEHKIRSFYNNIAAPNSDIGHVTIDTHAVAAGLFEALAGTDQEVIHNFGGTGKNINLGVGGTYGIIADAYREAAEKAGLRAREMQSITWEAVRGLFGENIKSTIKPKIRTEWSKYKNGEQSFDDTREKVMKIAGGIDNPDWVGSGAGDFVSNGGASYDKAFTPEGGVRLREAKDIRENLTFNLSAVTNSIPGLRELYARAMGRDKEAYTLLQKVAESSLKFLLSKTNARVNVDYAKGVYLSDREPSISVSVSFAEKQMPEVMAGLAKFADSYNQQQIHVRQETAQKFGHDFGDGSYATAVYEIDLKKPLSNDAISRVIDESGLQGFTITDQKLTTYFVRTEGNEQNNFKSFTDRVKRVHGLVGVGSSRIKQTVERLYVYGDGYGARIPYSEVAIPTSDIRTEQKSDTVTPKLIAEYLTKAPVTTFKQKPLNAKQVKDQKRLAKAWDQMPINDLQNPLVKRAYTALANSLKEQFKVIPIKVELMETIDEPYANSDAVRRDVSLNNRFKVYATTPETFGPPGSNFKNHPLLKDSGLKDVNGKPMLYNDLLRAVHDYFAHNLTETQFGPNGEAAAWRNHMAITPDPFARWALTAETRGQNAWQNFRPGVEGLNLLERGFADQKAALPPIDFVMTGDAKVDQPVTELKEVLTPEQQRGSVPVTAKYSLKTYFPTAKEAEDAAYRKAPPTTSAFKRWFSKSIVKEEGRPLVMYHASRVGFNAFRENAPIFVSPYAEEAEYFGRAHEDESVKSEDKVNVYPLWVRAEKPFDFENSDNLESLNFYLDSFYGRDPDLDLTALSDKVAKGEWETIESPEIQEAIRGLGFDSFYVKENGKKNLAVFDANQVKSATGNTGEFGETKDMRFSLRNVDTPEFKRFFGDSKVVNADGTPRVVYHGTTKDFDIPKTSFKREEYAKFGFHVGTEEAANTRLVQTDGLEAQGANIMPVYVRAENPLRMDENRLGRWGIDDIMSAVMEKAERGEIDGISPDVIDDFFNDRFDIEAEVGVDDNLAEPRVWQDDGMWMPGERSSYLKAFLQQLGYDSIVYNNEFEGGGDSYILLDPAQIKSATGNIGTYERNNRDIRYSLRNVDTPEFKRFYAGSKFVNADGTPKVLYHGTKSDIDTFKAGNGTFGRGIYVTEYPERTNQYWGKYGKFGEPMGPQGGNVMPVYVRMANPKPITTDIFKVKRPDGSAMTRDEAAEYITNQAIAEGYDGLVNMSGDKVWEAVVFNPYQIKSAIGNTGAYSRAEPSIKLSFPSIADQIAQTKNGTDINDSILGTTTVREEDGFIERMMSAISPESFSRFRASAINRYNQMSVNDKKMAQAMGGIELLADASAEFAALQSDTSAGVAAAVMGYGESKGGVPVYDKGYTTVSDLNGTVKGLTELLMPLAVRGDPYIYRAFQFYSGVKRGTRLDAEGKEKLFDKKDIQFAKDLELLYPEFKQVHADWIKYNNGHVDYMVKTGVLTPEKGAIFKKYADYIPFYRQLEGEETFGPNIFQSLANVKAPKKIKGGEAPLADFLETVVRNTQASVQSGMKNIAATRAIDQALFLGTASQLPQVSSAPNTVTLLRNGIPVSYAVSDRLLFDAMQSLNLPEMPFLGILAGPANLLRNLVTKDPGFMLANMMRDSLAAYATSGADITPMVDTIRNFGRVMANRSPEFYALMNAGAIGGYDFSKDVATSGGELAKDLRKKSKTQTDTEKALRPITSLWGFLEKSTEASDAATRIAVYKDVLQRTGNEAEAIRQAIEVMNFNRKGSSPIIRIVTAAIPFLNARIQGLDVLYRAGMAPRPAGVSKTDHQRRVQKNFIIRGTTMMALSSMYWFMMQDDDEYKKQEQEVRDNNWILPMIGARIPIPFEVGVLFKVIPERLLAFAFGGDTGEDLANSMERALRSTFGVNYLPQTILPLVEARTNYSYFTMRPIVGQGLEGVRPGLQVGPNTTQIAQTVGNALNVSPIKIDHVVQGYTGTMGMYLVSAIDAIFDAMSDVQKPSLRPDQYPIVKRFAINKEAKGTLSAYFELKDAVDETVRTVNILKSTGQGDELSSYMEGKHRMFGLQTASLLGARGYITNMDAKMKPLLENAKKVRASDMSSDEKRDALSDINQALISMTSDIQEIKKGLSE
jgi:hypothetical protein